MTQSTHARRPRTGSKTIRSMSWHGQHSLQTSIPLNIFGVFSKGSLPTTKGHQPRWRSCGTEYRWNGRQSHSGSVRDWLRACLTGLRLFYRLREGIPSTRLDNLEYVWHWLHNRFQAMASKMTQYLKKYSCVRLSSSTVRKPRNIAIEHNLHDSDQMSRYRDICRKALIYHFWKQFCQVL